MCAQLTGGLTYDGRVSIRGDALMDDAAPGIVGREPQISVARSGHKRAVHVRSLSLLHCFRVGCSRVHAAQQLHSVLPRPSGAQ